VSLTELLAQPAAARAALDRRELTVLELTEAALARAAELQPRIGAFAQFTAEPALERSRMLDAELRAGRSRGPLHGLPIAVKDVIDVAGAHTRLGTPAAGHRLPAENSAVVERLLAAGAVVIGKAVTHELAYGMITPAARNPRDPERITGGSSGGSAAAVAAGIVALALGTDTNGSVRCPAAHCGVVGLKPSRGALPLDGVARLAWSQDTVGLLAPDVRAAVDGWAALAPGHRSGAPPEGARIGVDRSALAMAEPDVEAAVFAALERLGREGAEIVEVRAPDLALAGAASVVAIVAEAARAWDGELERNPRGFGPQVRGALRAGRELPEAAYLDAKRVRVLLCAEMRELFEREALHALALPSVPLTATPAGVERVSFRGRQRSVESLQSLFTALASLTGQPALSVPCGEAGGGLPVGLQLLGRAGRENELLGIALRVQAAMSPFV